MHLSGLFLKAYFGVDISVHRILIEERGILHRDLSWGNVLINYSHLEGPKDKLDGHGFIDDILGDRYVLIHFPPDVLFFLTPTWR